MSLAQNEPKYKDQYFIKYHPEFKRFFGSEKAALLFQQLEYWSSKYPPGFWKFFEPCAHHPQYRQGDSWEEELGFSRRVFLKAFSVIGTHYKSKSDYLAQQDPFQGKMYASYYDRKTNRTHFLRDHSRVKQFLISFWQGAKKMAKSLTKKVQKCRSGNDTKSRSFACAYKDNISLQTSTSSHKLTKTLSPPPLDPLEKTEQEQEEKNIQLAQDMLGIWNNITQNHEPLKPHLQTKLPQAFLKSFQGSLEVWTEFCKTVASSKFLMGEAPNTTFKAYLAWLIKPKTVQAIKDQHYSLGDREVNYDLPSKAESTFDPEEVQGTETWKKVCEQLCQRLGYGTFISWFKDLKFLNEETPYPVVQCSSPFKRDWISTRYWGDIEQAVKQLLPQAQRVEISL